MSDFKRLLEDGSDFERSLLKAGRDEDPSQELEGRILAALAATPLIEAAELPASTPAPAPRDPSLFRLTAPRGLAMAAAVIGIGAVIAASVGGRNEAPSGAPAAVAAAPAPAPAPLVTAAPAEEKPETVITPDSLPTAPAPAVVPSARAAATPSAVRAAGADSGTSIEREIELLDAVKSRLGAGNTAEAARALDAYDAEFPQGALRPEGTVLRIRTLLLQGNRAAASKMADDFLAKHPGSVHAKRIRALLAD